MSKKYRVRTDEFVLGHYAAKDAYSAINKAISAYNGHRSLDNQNFYAHKAKSHTPEIVVS